MSVSRDLHFDKLLSNLAMGYRPDGMIADMVAPVVRVPNQSDYYAVFSRADALRIENDIRAPGVPANVITRSVTSERFFCNNYALAYAVTIEDKANADPIFVTEMINGKVRYTMDKLALSWESRLALQVNSTSNVGSSSAVSSAWTDPQVSRPLDDIETALNSAQDLTGKRPNRVVFSDQAWREIRINDQVRNRVLGVDNGGGNVSREQVKNLLEMDQLLVGAAYQNTANEAQSEVLSQIWTDNVLLYYGPSAPSMEQPSFMYTFRWTSAGLPSAQVERHPFNRETKSEKIESGYYQDERITGSEYSFLITAVTSST